MRFFRSTWLQRILLFLLPVLLSAGPFGFIAQEGDGKDEFIIHANQFLPGVSSLLKQPEIKYGFDVLHVSAVTISKKIISADYISEISFDPLSIDLITCLSRGPPRIITLL
jgi:hypothetical protein